MSVLNQLFESIRILSDLNFELNEIWIRIAKYVYPISAVYRNTCIQTTKLV